MVGFFAVIGLLGSPIVVLLLGYDVFSGISIALGVILFPLMLIYARSWIIAIRDERKDLLKVNYAILAVLIIICIYNNGIKGRKIDPYTKYKGHYEQMK